MKFKLCNKAKKTILTLTTALALTTMTGCYVNAGTTNTTTESDSDTKVEGVETYITLADNKTTVSGEGASVTSNIVTLTKGGTYYFTGTLTNGGIVVNSEEDVEIVLNGASITNQSGSAIYGINGDISLKAQKDTVNTLVDGETYTDQDEDSEPNACVFSHDRITIKGAGTLNITANYEDGIASKDHIKINNSILNITAVDDGIRGKDYVELNGGTVTITCEGGDAIKSKSGDITLNDGTYTLTSGKKGIESASVFTMNGGNLDVKNCTEGIEAVKIIINDGDIHIKASDDGINAADKTTKQNSENNQVNNFDGKFNPPNQVNQNNNTDDSNNTDRPTPPDMPVDMPTPPDFNSENFNPENGNPPEPPANNEKPNNENNTENNSGFRPMGGGGGPMGDYSENCSIEINGGYLYIDATGDGIDSNGNLTFNGGLVIVNGPTSNGDGALDASGDITYNGGTVIAAGSSGMHETPSANLSSGYTVSLKTSTISAGTLVTILDSNSNVLLAFKPAKDISAIAFSSDLISDGETVSIYTGGEYSGELSSDGYATGGALTSGTLLETISITDKTTSSGTSNSDFGFGRGGRDKMNRETNGGMNGEITRGMKEKTNNTNTTNNTEIVTA